MVCPTPRSSTPGTTLRRDAGGVTTTGSDADTPFAVRVMEVEPVCIPVTTPVFDTFAMVESATLHEIDVGTTGDPVESKNVAMIVLVPCKSTESTGRSNLMTASGSGAFKDRGPVPESPPQVRPGMIQTAATSAVRAARGMPATLQRIRERNGPCARN